MVITAHATMVNKTNLNTQVLLQNLFALSKMEILPYVIRCYKDNLHSATPPQSHLLHEYIQELLRPISL